MRILLILDTNKINSEDFKKNIPGGDYINLVKYIRDNNLQSKVHLGITETVLRELYRHKKDAYSKAITDVNNAVDKIKGTPDHNTTISYPRAKEYEQKILRDIEYELTKYDFVKIIKLSNTKKAVALDTIIETCNKEQQRLNDQLIIEEIRHYRYFGNYDRVILYTNNVKDFDNYCPSNIDIVISKEDLISSLDSIFLISETEEEKKLKSFLTTDYAKDMIENAIEIEYGYTPDILKIQYMDMPEDGYFIVQTTSHLSLIDQEVKHNIVIDEINNIISVNEIEE